MEAARLQDRLEKASGLAARKYGSLYTVYRPTSTDKPICDRNRLIRLFAAFEQHGKPGYGDNVSPFWLGVFDSSYTRAGDYLVSQDRTFFVATQLPFQRPVCVLTNHVVTAIRPTCPMQGGYSGLYASAGSVVFDGWPASLTSTGSSSGLLDTGAAGQESGRLLVPRLSGKPQPADVVTDECETAYVIGAVEPNLFGWRLTIKRIRT